MGVSWWKALLIFAWVLIYNNFIIGIILRNSKTALHDHEALDTTLNLYAGQKIDSRVCKCDIKDIPLPSEEGAKAMLELSILKLEHSKLVDSFTRARQKKRDYKKEARAAKAYLTTCEKRLRESQTGVCSDEIEFLRKERDQLRADLRTAQVRVPEIERLRRELLEARQEADGLRGQLAGLKQDLDRIARGDPGKIASTQAIQERDAAKAETERVSNELQKTLTRVDELTKSPEKAVALLAAMLKERHDAFLEAENAKRELEIVKSELVQGKASAEPQLLKERDHAKAAAEAAAKTTREVLAELREMEKSPEAATAAAAKAIRERMEAETKLLGTMAELNELKTVLAEAAKGGDEAKMAVADLVKERDQYRAELEHETARLEKTLAEVAGLLAADDKKLPDFEAVLKEAEQAKVEVQKQTRELTELKTDLAALTKSPEKQKAALAKAIIEKHEAKQAAEQLMDHSTNALELAQSLTKGMDPAKVPIAGLAK